MVTQAITTDIDANRVDELAQVLDVLSQKILAYVAHADSPQGTVGKASKPQDLLNLFDLPKDGDGVDGLFKQVDMILANSVVTWNAGFMDKLYAGTNPVGIASDLLLSVLNTNSHVFSVSPALTVIERKTAHEYAKMFGFNKPHSGGLTFPGGSYSNSTSLTTARSYLFPDTKVYGNGAHRFAVFASSHAHYSVEKAAIFCGLGSNSVFKIKTTEDGRMCVSDLEAQISQAKADGYTPLFVNATAGTTVYGSFDDFNAIADVAQKHGAWFHIDGSWGGNIVFSESHRYKLAGCERADSITVNPHKALGVPATCSFLLVPDVRVFLTANSLQAPYLFHNADPDDESYDLADGTMGCGRRPDAVKLYLGWHWYGARGYGARIDHALRVAAHLAESVKARPSFVLASEDPVPFLQVCFFYAPPSQNGGELSSDPAVNTQVTRSIIRKLHEAGEFLVDFAPEARGKQSKSRGEFFRVVVNAPSVSSDTVDELLDRIEHYGKSLKF